MTSPQSGAARPTPEVGDDARLALARRCAAVMWADDSASRGLRMRLESVSPGRAEVRMRVTEAMVNGHGICHGGFVAALADSAFAFACNTYDDVTVAAGFDIVFVTAAHLGDELAAQAVERVRRGRSGVYDVTVTRVSAEAAGAHEVPTAETRVAAAHEVPAAGARLSATQGQPATGDQTPAEESEQVEVIAEFRGRSRSLGRPVLPRQG